MKKTWGIILLIIFFLWTLSRDVLSLFSSADSVDRAVYEGNGIGAMFFVVAIVAVALDVAAVFFLFKPAKIGFYVLLAAVFWSVLGNTLVTILVLANPEAAKAAYIASRVERGLSVRPELYDALFTPVGMIAVLAIAILINGLVALLAFLNRRYFFGERTDVESAVA